MALPKSFSELVEDTNFQVQEGQEEQEATIKTN